VRVPWANASDGSRTAAIKTKTHFEAPLMVSLLHTTEWVSNDRPAAS
jgi:hypothetical protein